MPRVGGFGLLILAASIIQMGPIPPITLLSVGLMIVCSVQPTTLFHWPNIGSVCISADTVVYGQEWGRVLLAPIFHGNDMYVGVHLGGPSKFGGVSPKFGKFGFWFGGGSPQIWGDPPKWTNIEKYLGDPPNILQYLFIWGGPPQIWRGPPKWTPTMHLYYNMISFILKGRQLEPKLGDTNYAILLCTLSIATNMVYIGINVLLAKYISYSYMHQCPVGFSGVIFALKVILAHFTPNAMSRVMGIFNVPIRYALWLELALISVLVPNASLVGHLSGILVGIILVWLYSTVVRRRNYFHGQPRKVGSRREERRREEERGESERERLKRRGENLKWGN